MQFDTATYVVFLTLVLAGYWLLRRASGARILLLLVASYLFYMWWNARFIGLIVASTLLDFWVGQRLHRCQDPRRRKLLLWISLGGNLGLLAFFKYTNFVLRSVSELGGWLGLDLSYGPLAIVLPVGISFYTFQSMSYTIDIYRRRLEPVRSLFHFALFVAFFPQLVAGPIVRARTFLPQLAQRPRMAPRRMVRGLFLIAVGLTKKVVFANLLAMLVVDRIFLDPTAYHSYDALLGAYAYTFQIYFDFSAYSDIAIGSAMLFGLRLPANFRHPFLAQNPSDLWRRWHISLSTWLRDYLYIPLGGNRRGRARTQVNLMATMLLGGLWHGASWNFVFWGFLHGFYLLLHRWWCALFGPGQGPRALPRWVKVAVMFHLTCLAFVFFRCATLEQAFALLRNIAGDGGPEDLKNRGWCVLGFAALVAGHLSSTRWLFRLEHGFLRLPLLVQALLLALLTGALGVFAYGARPFIYFQF